MPQYPGIFAAAGALGAGGNSWRLATFGSRHSGATPFAYNDADLVKLRDENIDLQLSVTDARAENTTTGTFDMGGEWAGSGDSDDYSGGHSVEIFPASGETIAWGTTQTQSTTSTVSSVTFASLTGLSGHDKVIAVIQYTIAFGLRSDDWAGALSATLNGAAMTIVPGAELTYNVDSDRYKTTQTAILYIDSPADGDLVIDASGKDWSALTVMLLPVDGAASGDGAFGTPSTTAVLSTSTTLSNSLDVVGA